MAVEVLPYVGEVVYYLHHSRFNNHPLHIDKHDLFSLQGAGRPHCSSSLLFCKCKLPSGRGKKKKESFPIKCVWHSSNISWSTPPNWTIISTWFTTEAQNILIQGPDSVQIACYLLCWYGTFAVWCIRFLNSLKAYREWDSNSSVFVCLLHQRRDI